MRISDWSSDVCSSDLLRARDRYLRGLHALRREEIAPLAAVHAELLQVGDEAVEVAGAGDKLNGFAGVLVVGRQDHRVLAALGHEEKTLGVRCQGQPVLALAIGRASGREKWGR